MSGQGDRVLRCARASRRAIHRNGVPSDRQRPSKADRIPGDRDAGPQPPGGVEACRGPGADDEHNRDRELTCNETTRTSCDSSMSCRCSVASAAAAPVSWSTCLTRSSPCCAPRTWRSWRRWAGWTAAELPERRRVNARCPVFPDWTPACTALNSRVDHSPAPSVGFNMHGSVRQRCHKLAQRTPPFSASDAVRRRDVQPSWIVAAAHAAKSRNQGTGRSPGHRPSAAN